MSDGNGNGNLPPTRDIANIFGEWLLGITKMFGLPRLHPDRIQGYAEALHDVSLERMEYAFRQVRREFQPRYYGDLPSPAELRRWAESMPLARTNMEVEDIDPERCPKGWTPEEVKRARVTMKVIREQAARPFPREPGEEAEPGETRREYAQRLIQEMREHIQGEAFTMPVPRREDFDTEEQFLAARQRWAHEKAVEGGWIEKPDAGTDGD